jgi:hypothetical protein
MNTKERGALLNLKVKAKSGRCCWYWQRNHRPVGSTVAAGCEYCEILVYCQSGNRAGQALLKLEAAGFQKLSNGQGTIPRTGQSYSLVTTPSVR